MCPGIYKCEVLNLLVVVALVFLIVNVALFMYWGFVVVNVLFLSVLVECCCCCCICCDVNELSKLALSAFRICVNT